MICGLWLTVMTSRWPIPRHEAPMLKSGGWPGDTEVSLGFLLSFSANLKLLQETTPIHRRRSAIRGRRRCSVFPGSPWPAFLKPRVWPVSSLLRHSRRCVLLGCQCPARPSRAACSLAVDGYWTGEEGKPSFQTVIENLGALPDTFRPPPPPPCRAHSGTL